MISTTAIVLASLYLMGFVLIFAIVVLPWIRLELKRRASRSIRPVAQQIWVQDGELLYVTDVNPTGVELMSWNSERREVNRWKDTWPEWQRRLEIRSIFYSGEKRPLGDL